MTVPGEMGLRASSREDVEPLPAPQQLRHPFLMNPDWQRVRGLCASDRHAEEMHQILRRNADQIFAKPLAAETREAMLVRARNVLKRVPLLAGLYRMDGDRRYLDRAIAEMKAATQIDRWDDETFLATAELMNAMGIGYDWLYDQLGEADRREIADAIVEKGLRRGLENYASRGGWTTANHNWNLVCNGGLAVAALAVCNESPEVAREVLDEARQSIRHGLASYQPDGGWAEGPMYWNYATRYAVYYFSALQSANMLPRMDREGFGQTGYFRIYTTGPAGKVFNFADSDETLSSGPDMLWLSSAFNQPAYAWFDELSRASDGSIFDLLWLTPRVASPGNLPMGKIFLAPGVVSMRSSWTDPNATFVAAKAGDNLAHHGHYDLGTFVIDMLGERWASELGADNYDLPEYFGKRRADYLRCATRGHNTITLDDAGQLSDGTGEILSANVEAPEPFAIFDLSAGYDDVKTFLRGVKLLPDHSVLINDDITPENRSNITWRMYTPASVSIDHGVATLEQNGKQVRAVILSPAGMTWNAAPVTLRPPQKPATGMTCLSLKIRSNNTTRIIVWISPDRTAKPPVVQPMRNWK